MNGSCNGGARGRGGAWQGQRGPGEIAVGGVCLGKKVEKSSHLGFGMRSTDKEGQELTVGDSGGPGGEPTGLLPSAGI